MLSAPPDMIIERPYYLDMLFANPRGSMCPDRSRFQLRHPHSSVILPLGCLPTYNAHLNMVLLDYARDT